MTMMICRLCGSDLKTGARFCASCGAVAPVAEIANLYAPEPGRLHGKGIEQPVPSQTAVTEEMPTILTTRNAPSDDNEAGSQL